MSQVDITFVWPPMGSIYYIHPAVPLLAGFSRSIGLKVRQIDASIGFNRYLFSHTGILKHRPGKKAPLGLICLWKFLSDNVEKIWSPTEGNNEIKFKKEVFIMNSALYYYSIRYQNTKFDDFSFFAKRNPILSSSSLLTAARYLSVQRNHPLISYYRNDVLQRITDQQPRILGISVSDIGQLLPSLVLVILVHRSGLKCHVTMGGDYISTFIARLNEKKRFFTPVVIDSYVIGDGEPALEGFKRFLDGKCDYDDIDNSAANTRVC